MKHQFNGSQMDEKYVQADSFIDHDEEAISDFALRVVGNSSCQTPIDTAVKLYYAVRDKIFYDPYTLSREPVDYRASNILAKRRGFCVQKAVLLCALARAMGIPARLGFATVTNHLASRKLMHFIGTHIFVFHGYTEFWLGQRWIKATPAFNHELCDKYRVPPLEFNGRDDALFQPYNSAKKPFMEYIGYHGSFSTVPLQQMLKAWEDFYGAERVQGWFDIKCSTFIKERSDFLEEAPFNPE